MAKIKSITGLSRSGTGIFSKGKNSLQQVKKISPLRVRQLEGLKAGKFKTIYSK